MHTPPEFQDTTRQRSRLRDCSSKHSKEPDPEPGFENIDPRTLPSLVHVHLRQAGTAPDVFYFGRHFVIDRGHFHVRGDVFFINVFEFVHLCCSMIGYAGGRGVLDFDFDFVMYDSICTFRIVRRKGGRKSPSCVGTWRDYRFPLSIYESFSIGAWPGEWTVCSNTNTHRNQGFL